MLHHQQFQYQQVFIGVKPVTPNEAAYIDRLFLKALALTPFGAAYLGLPMIEGDSAVKFMGADRLYMETRVAFFDGNPKARNSLGNIPESRNSDAAYITGLPFAYMSEDIRCGLSGTAMKAVKAVDGVSRNIAMFCMNDSRLFRQGAYELYNSIQRLQRGFLTIDDIHRLDIPDTQNIIQRMMDSNTNAEGFEVRIEGRDLENLLRQTGWRP